jgi:hypothetical protein
MAEIMTGMASEKCGADFGNAGGTPQGDPTSKGLRIHSHLNWLPPVIAAAVALSGINIIDNVTNLLRTIKLRTATCLEK